MEDIVLLYSIAVNNFSSFMVYELEGLFENYPIN